MLNSNTNKTLVKCIWKYIRDPLGVFSISSIVKILMTSLPEILRLFVQTVSLSIYIKRKSHDGVKIWIYFTHSLCSFAFSTPPWNIDLYIKFPMIFWPYTVFYQFFKNSCQNISLPGEFRKKTSLFRQPYIICIRSWCIPGCCFLCSLERVLLFQWKKEVLPVFQSPLPNDDRQILMNKQNPKAFMVNVLQGVLKIGTNYLIMICLFSLLQVCFQTTR